MNLNNGEDEFETMVNAGLFWIAITQESSLSTDGGHSFEDVINTYKLDKQAAMALLNELKLYLGDV